MSILDYYVKMHLENIGFCKKRTKETIAIEQTEQNSWKMLIYFYQLLAFDEEKFNGRETCILRAVCSSFRQLNFFKNKGSEREKAFLYKIINEYGLFDIKNKKSKKALKDKVELIFNSIKRSNKKSDSMRALL